MTRDELIAATGKPFGGVIRDAIREFWGDKVMANGPLYDDPRGRWREGERIHTSCIVKDHGDGLVETRNTIYQVEWRVPASEGSV